MINRYKDWLSVKDTYKNIYPDGYLNNFAYRKGVISEGEGLNFQIFTQGCRRYCRGCWNVPSFDMIPNNLIGIRQLVQKVKENARVAVPACENVSDPDGFLEKLYLLHLENQLMAQRRLTFHHSPFKEISYALLSKAWDIRISLLKRLIFSLNNNGRPGKVNKTIPLTGVILTGGEPLYQAENILKFVKETRKHLSLGIWIMTGFTYEDIIRYKETRDLCAAIDYLIDGCFILNKMNFAHPMRGSMNQRIINTAASLKKKKIVSWEPRYRWTRLFTPYWERFSDPKRIQDYNPFINPDEVMFFLINSERIDGISTVREYEECFGNIQENFSSRILR